MKGLLPVELRIFYTTTPGSREKGVIFGGSSITCSFFWNFVEGPSLEESMIFGMTFRLPLIFLTAHSSMGMKWWILGKSRVLPVILQ